MLKIADVVPFRVYVNTTCVKMNQHWTRANKK